MVLKNRQCINDRRFLNCASFCFVWINSCLPSPSLAGSQYSSKYPAYQATSPRNRAGVLNLGKCTPRGSIDPSWPISTYWVLCSCAYDWLRGTLLQEPVRQMKLITYRSILRSETVSRSKPKSKCLVSFRKQRKFRLVNQDE